ncbi:SAM-dependent methyltransferase [Streptomyces sp. NPDC055897]
MSYGEKPQTRPIDNSHASAARMYDWLLGGTENYDVDRAACATLLEIAPSTQQLARNNRAFLRRVVKYLVEVRGISQFLDHGSGLPTQDNVHEVAQSLNKDAKVVYVDNDPMVLAHAETYLNDNANTRVLDFDFRHTDRIHRATTDFLDWDEPIAALFVSVLHCIPDSDGKEDPAAVIREVSSRLAPGSCMVICQLVSERADVRDGVTQLMADATDNRWGRVREPAEVERYFDTLRQVPPGLVDVIDWLPDSAPPPQERRAKDWVEWGGVGIVPART